MGQENPDILLEDIYDNILPSYYWKG